MVQRYLETLRRIKMKRIYNIFYNDGVYYGTMTINGNRRKALKSIKNEIIDNNKNINKNYHISKKNFKRI